jgi:hypothetical protein
MPSPPLSGKALGQLNRAVACVAKSFAGGSEHSADAVVANITVTKRQINPRSLIENSLSIVQLLRKLEIYYIQSLMARKKCSFAEAFDFLFLGVSLFDFQS